MDSDLSSSKSKKKKKKKKGKNTSKEQFENMRGGNDEMHAPSVETTSPAICGEANTEGLFFFKCGAIRGALIILSFVLARFFVDVLNGGQVFSFAMRFKEEPSNGSASPYRVGFSSGELLKTSEGLSKCSADNLKPEVAVGDWKMCLKDEDDTIRTLLLDGFVLDGFETAEGPGVFDGIVFESESEPTSDAKGKRRSAAGIVAYIIPTTIDSWCGSLSDTYGAFLNQSSYSLYQNGSACDLWTVEFSGQREGCFDFHDQDFSLVKKGHSHGSVIVDPLSGKNRAEISVRGNRRSYWRCQINGTSLSEEEKETLLLLNPPPLRKSRSRTPL